MFTFMKITSTSIHPFGEKLSTNNLFISKMWTSKMHCIFQCVMIDLNDALHPNCITHIHAQHKIAITTSASEDIDQFSSVFWDMERSVRDRNDPE